MHAEANKVPFPITICKTASEKRGTPSAAVRNMKKTGKSMKKLHKVVNAIAAEFGIMTQDSLHRRMLEIRATVLLSKAHVDGGALCRNSIQSHICPMCPNCRILFSTLVPFLAASK